MYERQEVEEKLDRYGISSFFNIILRAKKKQQKSQIKAAPQKSNSQSYKNPLPCYKNEHRSGEERKQDTNRKTCLSNAKVKRA